MSSIHKSISKIEKRRDTVYNIAYGKSISIKNLAELMISISGKKLDIRYQKPKEGDIRFSQADISLAKKELGYFPKIELEEGIKDLI